MHAWEAIQNSLNYIEEHLPENMKIETLAGVASLSPYYFQRLFGRLVKKSVNEYVKLRKLARASETLKSKDKRIMDVALDYGFADHAGFTRAFKNAYGITPDEYRASPVILNQFIKPDLLLDYTAVDENVPLIADGIIVEVTCKKLDEPRTFIGIEGEVPDAELSLGKTTGVATAGIIWDEFHRLKPDVPHLLPGGSEIGVLYTGNAREGCCTYLAGAEAARNAQAEGYAAYMLPPGEYAICCFEAENFAELIGSAIFKASSFMNGWMKKHSLACGGIIAEMYYSTSPDASYMELWLSLGLAEKTKNVKETWDKTNGNLTPSMAAISAYVDSPLFECLTKHVEAEYQCKPVLEYSRCSMQYGWNVKYKKAGRTLCTLYPMEGYFVSLIVIGEHEKAETELMLPSFTIYLQQLYRETKTGMGQKWLMINVTDDAVLEDVKQCIAIRRGKRK
jgi:AraC family transcriptional regulator